MIITDKTSVEGSSGCLYNRNMKTSPRRFAAKRYGNSFLLILRQPHGFLIFANFLKG